MTLGSTSRRGRVFRSLADLIRLLTILSLAGGLPFFPIESTLRLLLLLVVLLVARRARLPGGFDAAFGGVMLLAAWAGPAGWYGRLTWLDTIAHTTTPGLTAVALILILASSGILDLAGRSRLVQIIVTLCLALAFGLAAATLWEIYEWKAFALLSGDTITVDYRDTMEDLASGGFGSLAGGLALVSFRFSFPRLSHPADCADTPAAAR